MKTLKLIFAITALLLFAGCQSESFNPVDSGITVDKNIPQTKISLVPFDKKEPNASGVITYTKQSPKNFSFRGTGLLPNTQYAVYYGTEVIGMGKTNGGGNLNIQGIFSYSGDTQFSVWYTSSVESFRLTVDINGKVLIEKASVGESIK